MAHASRAIDKFLIHSFWIHRLTFCFQMILDMIKPILFLLHINFEFLYAPKKCFELFFKRFPESIDSDKLVVKLFQKLLFHH